MKTDGTNAEARLERPGKDHVRLVLRERQDAVLRLARSRRTRPARRSRIRRRDMCGVSIRSTSTPSNRDGTGLKRITNYNTLHGRGRALAGREAHRLHVAEGRRPRHLHDERRRQRRPPAHASGRATTAARGGRPTARRSPTARYHPTDPAELKDYQDLLKQHIVRPTQDGALGHERRRQRPAPDHASRRRELRPFVDARRQASSFFRRTTRIRTAAISICISWTSTAADSSRSRPTKDSMVSRCSARTGSSSSGRRTAMRRASAR